MKKETIKRIGAIVMVVGIFLLLHLEEKEFEKKRKELEAIADEVRPMALVKKCKEIGEIDESLISIRGKCLLWDLKTNSPISLPKDLQAKSSDRPITIFLIIDKGSRVIGYYSISEQPAFQTYADICIVYWPEKKVIGMHSIFGKMPRFSRPVINVPEYTYENADRLIINWIKSLPKSNP